MPLPKFIAAVEVDQRQAVIHATDKLKEVLGGSWTIDDTRDVATEATKDEPHVNLMMPVSGQIWLAADGFPALARVLWKLREKIVEEWDLPATFAVVPLDGKDFDTACKELEKGVRAEKDAKAGENGRASLPGMAHCRIQPTKAANRWIFRHEGPDQDHRRALISNSSERRRKKGNKTLDLFRKKFEVAGGPGYLNGYGRWPEQLEHLVASDSDKFIALIKADADGMGQLTSSLIWTDLVKEHKWDKAEWDTTADEVGWSSPAEKDSWAPQEIMTAFCLAVDGCLHDAIDSAVNGVLTKRPGKADDYFPVAPIVIGGEDIWIVCRRDLALELAMELGEAYAKSARSNGVLRDALATLPKEDRPELTLSFGILFAKCGFPIEIMGDLAEELLRSAKDRRSGAEPKEGWVDYHWLDSTGRQSISEYRRQGLAYMDAGREFLLYTRPWRLSQLGPALKHARAFRDGIPPGKLAQLETAMRLGTDLSDLAYRQWRLRLDKKGRQALDGAGINERSPWGPPNPTGGFSTRLLELAELAAIVGG